MNTTEQTYKDAFFDILRVFVRFAKLLENDIHGKACEKLYEKAMCHERFLRFLESRMVSEEDYEYLVAKAYEFYRISLVPYRDILKCVSRHIKEMDRCASDCKDEDEK